MVGKSHMIWQTVICFQSTVNYPSLTAHKSLCWKSSRPASVSCSPIIINYLNYNSMIPYYHLVLTSFHGNSAFLIHRHSRLQKLLDSRFGRIKHLGSHDLSGRYRWKWWDMGFVWDNPEKIRSNLRLSLEKMMCNRSTNQEWPCDGQHRALKEAILQV